MSDQLFQLRRDCGAASDDYFRVLTTWLTAEPREQKTRDECLFLAIAYDKAIRALLDRLRSLPPTTELTDEIARAVQIQQLLGPAT